METEVTTFLNLPVYTPGGRYVGVVSNVVIDLPTRRATSLLLTRTSPELVEGARDVAVPYRWVAAVGHIIILNFFPAHVDANVTSFGAKEKEEPLTA